MASGTISINEGRVVHETVDDEVIIIDLETGSYFSLTKSAADLWPAIVEGTTKDRLTAKMTAVYDASPSDIEASIASFLAPLNEEEIILVEPGNGATVDELAPADGRQRLPFEPPKLEKFTNMSDLLLLVDPFHDVDAQGWPNTKPD